MDPLGNVPVFLSILKDVDAERRTRIIVRELLIALALLLVFLFFGQFILHAMRITEPSLSIAGGIILFIIALRMIFPAEKAAYGVDMEREPFIVPLAIPLVAGPSSLATVLLLVTREPDRVLDWGGAILIAWAATVLILTLSSHFARFFGRRGLIAMERLMGMILTIISVEMFLAGIKQFMAS